jgi:hypothetical protein
MSTTVSLRAIAVAVALVLVGSLLALMTAMHRPGTPVAKPNPGSGCVFAGHKVGKQPVLHITICVPDIDTSSTF